MTVEVVDAVDKVDVALSKMTLLISLGLSPALMTVCRMRGETGASNCDLRSFVLICLGPESSAVMKDKVDFGLRCRREFDFGLLDSLAYTLDSHAISS